MLLLSLCDVMVRLGSRHQSDLPLHFSHDQAELIAVCAVLCACEGITHVKYKSKQLPSLDFKNIVDF
jgi:hypothetical protein